MKNITFALALACAALLPSHALAAPSGSNPFEGTYHGDVDGWSVAITVASNGSISGGATPPFQSFCSTASISGRLTASGDFKMVLSYTCITWNPQNPLRWREKRYHWTIEGTASLASDGSLQVTSDDTTEGGFVLD